jgi:hypothetical protein
MSEPILLVGLITERIGQSVLMILALGGIYLLAYFLLWFAEKLMVSMPPVRLAVNTKGQKYQKASDNIKRFVAVAATALLAWLLYNAGQGGGPGGLFPGGVAESDRTQTLRTSENVESPKTTVKVRDTRKQPLRTEKGQGEVIRLHLLGGHEVQGDRFFRLPGQPEGLTLAEVKNYIEKRLAQTKSTGGVRRVEIIIDLNSRDNSPPVEQLASWVETKNLPFGKITPGNDVLSD